MAATLRSSRHTNVRSGDNASEHATLACPVRLEREDGRIVYGEMDQPIPTHGPYGNETGAFRIA